MRRDEVLRIIGEHSSELHGMGAQALWLFGSVARDQAGPSSDVDVLVEVVRPMGLFGLMRIKNRLEQLLGREVDLGTRDSLRPELRAEVEREMLRAA